MSHFSFFGRANGLLPYFSKEGSLIIVLDESGRYCGPEFFAGMTAQRVNKYVLDGLAMSGMLAVHAAAALSGAEMQSSGGARERRGRGE